MRNKRPPTKMMRVRTSDLKEIQELARQAEKKLPDFQKELIRAYKRARL